MNMICDIFQVFF